MDGGAQGNDALPEMESELFEEPGGIESIPPTIPEVDSEQAPEDTQEKLEKIGKVGRQRRYESPGIKKIPPVKDVVLFRYKMDRAYPGLSKDMEEWYEHYYFTKPTRAERAKDAKEYERHVKSWQRGRKWIAEEEGIEAVGDSDKVIPYRRRAGSER